MRNYGALYKDYDRQFYYWESCINVRKLLVVAAAVTLQVGCGMTCSVCVAGLGRGLASRQ